MPSNFVCKCANTQVVFDNLIQFISKDKRFMRVMISQKEVMGSPSPSLLMSSSYIPSSSPM